MSGITTGIGLVSGINSASLIDQLMAIEARPVQNLQARIQTLDIQRAAFLEISAQLLALQNSIAQFDKPSFFNRFTSTSSNEGILTATAGERAVPGSYTFRVHSLVTTHSVISKGFADRDGTPVGQGSLSIEVGNGRVNQSTNLEELNGGLGVQRGSVVITDRAGNKQEIDLSKAQSVDDVLGAINGNSALNVRAYVTGIASNGHSGDRIVIEDTTSAQEVVGNLIVANATGGSTASDLGLVANVAGNRIDGRDLIALSSSTVLSRLNDGNGIGKLGVGAGNDDLVFTRDDNPEKSFGVSLVGVLANQPDTDLRALNSGEGVRLGTVRITDRLGRSVEVNLADDQLPAPRTAQDVRERLAQAADAAGMSISVTFVNSAFQITDGSEVSDDSEATLSIEDLTGHAAADLGFDQSVEGPTISGREIYRISTVGDVINAINFAAGNNGSVKAAISDDGNGITLQALGKDTSITVSSGAGSTAAVDLGILDATFTDADGVYESRDLVAGLNTVLLRSLNGGNGIELGSISINGKIVDLATASQQPQTLQDVVDLINAELAADVGGSLAASINAAGTGIEIRDESGNGEQITIEDVNGSMATDLGIEGTHGNGLVNGANLQRQYVSRQTLLSDINLNRGVALGSFTITDSTGALHSVQLAGNLETVGQVIDAINAAGGGNVEARINDTGDGIVVVDNANGDLQLVIEDIDGGRAAADLRLAGTAAPGDGFIDGSAEIRIDLGAGDTLNDLVQKLADEGLQASVLNLGGSVNPFSLTISSPLSGRRGEMVIDARGIDLGMDTLSDARDAVITIGGAATSNPLFVTSPTNTIDSVIEGVTMNLIAPSDEDVTVSISQDIDGIVEIISGFVDRYNGVQSTIDDGTSFDQDTLARGPLLGDSTINLVRERLRRTIARQFDTASAQLSRLTAVGLRLVGNNRLEFNEERFRDAYEQSRELVEELFGAQETGFGAVFKTVIEDLTRDFDGVLARKDDLLSDQGELIGDRIERMNSALAAKRARLEAQFVGLESSLLALQAQQSSLNTLAGLTS